MGRARAPRDEMAVDPTAPSPGTPAALEPAEPLGASEIEGEGGVGPYQAGAAPPAAQQDRPRLRRDVRNHRAVVPVRTALREAHRPHDARRRTTSPTRSRSAARPRDVVSPGRHPHRPHVDREVPPRGGRQRPRRGGSPALRRAGTHWRSASSRPSSAVFFATIIALVRGVLPRLRRRRALADDGPDLGLSGDPARDRTRHRAGSGWTRLRPVHRQRRIVIHPGDHHRRRLRPVHGEAAPGAGAEPAGEGVRRGGPLTGGGEHADHVPARSSRTSPRASSSSSL